MRLWTASYGTWQPALGVPVVASLLTPRWIPEAAEWPRIIELTPRWSYWRAEPEEFDARFLAQLRRYGPQRISRRLTEIGRETGAEDLVICCFEQDAEGPSDCHRLLWSWWWLQVTGEAACEIVVDEGR